jgi:hypothetical protein
MIACGWCDTPTPPGACVRCGRDAALPWTQRGVEPPKADTPRRRLAEAYAAVGNDATVERLAEYLDVDPRTVRRWRQMSA